MNNSWGTFKEIVAVHIAGIADVITGLCESIHQITSNLFLIKHQMELQITGVCQPCCFMYQLNINISNLANPHSFYSIIFIISKLHLCASVLLVWSCSLLLVVIIWWLLNVPTPNTVGQFWFQYKSDNYSIIIYDN